MEVFLSDLKIKDPKSYNLVKASLLQKLIRRSMTQEALFIAKKYIEDGQIKALKRRLLIISCEDIGFANLNGFIKVHEAESEEDLLFSTMLLSQSFKNREADNFLIYTTTMPKDLKIRCDFKNTEIENFKIILKDLEIWFESKSKNSLNDLKEKIEKKITNHPDYQILNLLFEDYLFLTKNKVHGARCLIALFSLILDRTTQNLNPPPVSLISLEMNRFDTVFDFALDMHTPIGKSLNRGIEHWIKEGCVLVNSWLNPKSIDSLGRLKYPLGAFLNKK